MTAYRVELSCYEGPLDLLVQLARQNEIDILELALTEITARYLEIIRDLAGIDLDEVGDFLILITTLMEIKSRALLPTEEGPEETAPEETRQELVRQLIEYKRFREVASLLWERAREQQQKLRRLADDLPPEAADPTSQPIRELELWDLVSAFSRLMKENIVPVADTITRDPTPITTYMERMETRVLATGGITFRELLGLRNTRSQLIGKFLALLELIKCKQVWVELDEASMEILVLPPRAAATQPLAETPSLPMADPSIPPDAPALPPPKGTQEGPPEITPEAAPQAPEPKRQRASAWDDFEPLVPLDEPDEPTPPGTEDSVEG